MQRKRSVDRVLLKVNFMRTKCLIKISFCLVFVIISTKVSAEIEQQPYCKTLRIADLKKSPPSLSKLIRKLTKNLKGFSVRGVSETLHSKLNISYNELDRVLQYVQKGVKTPVEISIYKLWMLNNPQRQIGIALNCDSENQFSLRPHMDYETHYALWLQVMGQKELGRIFLTIVEDKNEWKVGFLTFSLWTHGGKNFEKWGEEGDKDLENKNFISAYLKYQLAQKLLVENPHLSIHKKSKISNFLEATLSKEMVLKDIRKIFPSRHVSDVNSFFAEKGVGVEIEFSLTDQTSKVDFEPMCREILLKVQKDKRFHSIVGLKCKFMNLPKAGFESELGHIFLPMN